MKQLLLGKSVVTSIVGYLLAGLMTWQELRKGGETDNLNIIIAVGIAIFGRVVADADRVKK